MGGKWTSICLGSVQLLGQPVNVHPQTSGMLKTYVEYYMPGIMVVETSSDRAIDRDPVNVHCSKRVFGFRFYDVEEVEINGELLKGEPKNYSNMYYFGKVYTIPEIKKLLLPNKDRLIDNLEQEKCDGIRTRCGNWQVFRPGDVVVSET